MKKNVTVVVPCYNAETTIYQTLESLFAQADSFEELIIINDASTDGSLKKINVFLNDKKNITEKEQLKVRIINHERSLGLASSYNDGIKNSKNELVVTLHADIILCENSIEKLIEPFFLNDSNRVVATFHCVIHPFEVWKKYNFWQKCFFSRLVRKKFCGLDGKFDCFRKSTLEKIGYFDGIKFKNAGEDGDITYRLGKVGKIVKTDAEIIHIHSMDPNFSFRHIIKKQKQYSESQGILLRMGRMHNIHNIPRVFFREILVISLLVPYLNFVAILIIIAYSFVYTKLVYMEEYNDRRIWILPALNVYLLLVSLAYSFKGFIYGKQKI